ncbi:MAG TPA: hypothetical protein VJK90_10955, partial [Acetobacteraceae bacterium]|nr:hypothetical protein [Acetobacteraceae bacterium]
MRMNTARRVDDPADCDRPEADQRIGLRRSLSVRLLLLVVGLVVVTEILLMVPAFDRDRRVILREKALEAYIAAL